MINCSINDLEEFCKKFYKIVVEIISNKLCIKCLLLPVCLLTRHNLLLTVANSHES